MSSRIVIQIEQPCTPAQAAQVYNQVRDATATDRLSAPDIEIIIQRGEFDRSAAAK